MRLPMTLDELFEAGGPFALIRKAEQSAGDNEARLWLATLQQIRPQLDASHLLRAVIVEGWIKSLRLRLGVRPSPDEVRAQTRERVRRFRAKRRA